jgi:hypothetical protein
MATILFSKIPVLLYACRLRAYRASAQACGHPQHFQRVLCLPLSAASQAGPLTDRISQGIVVHAPEVDPHPSNSWFPLLISDLSTLSGSYGLRDYGP